MSRATRDSAATRSLRTRIESKATGKLVIGGGELAVHLLNGEVLAATSTEDDRQIVRMLHLGGLLDDTRAEDLESVAGGGGDVFGELLALGLGVKVDPILRERFVQNLCDFVASGASPKWIEQKGVFVDNIQMGHSTPELVDDVCRLADLARALDAAALVARGAASPGKDPVRVAVAEALSTDPRPVEAVLHEVPVEPTRARVVLAELLLDGVAVQQPDPNEVPIDEDDTLMTSGVRRSVAPSAAPRPASRPPEPPRSTSPPVAPRSTAPPAPAPATPPVAPAPPPRPAPVEAAPERPKAEPPPAPRPAPAPEAPPPAPTPAAAPPRVSEPLPEPEEVDLEPLSEDGDVVLPEPVSEEAGAPRSLNDYLAKTASIDDDELDFFSDHDQERGGEADGRFRTDTHNLDKIDVGAGPEKEDDAIEVDEAPSSRFGAPPLSEEEAYAKIEVANEVLSTIATAFDEAEGSGRGRAVVQLLVDGVPHQFSALLHDLRIDDDGILPADRLIRNLADRPPTEHRQLLNNSLADIIERALSAAADELPDEAIDHVLENVAGYRGRLGL